LQEQGRNLYNFQIMQLLCLEAQRKSLVCSAASDAVIRAPLVHLQRDNCGKPRAEKTHLTP
jgi:hypothetical protein